jgi:hypothetical protein
MSFGRLFVSVFSLSTLVIGVACSGGGGGSTGGSTLTTSAPPNKEVSQLTPEEGKQYCLDVGRYFNAEMGPLTQKSRCLTEASRAMRGITSEADLRSKCSSEYQACLAKGEPPPDAFETENCQKTSTTCTATVAEVNKCLEDYVARARAAGATLDSFCSRIQIDGGGVESNFDSEAPASCKAISSKCPGIAGESDVATGSGN